MQAHPLSTPAARNSSLTPTSSLGRMSTPLPPSLLPPSTSTRLPASHHAAAYLVQEPIAEGAGLAHDAGNLLGALRLYSDLLRAPGVLRPEHQHYATELGLIAARSSTLIGRLLSKEPLLSSLATQPDADPPVDTHSLRPENPSGVLRALAPVLQRIAAGVASVNVTTSPLTPPNIRVPAEALERITVNLVRNAAEAIRLSRLGPSPAATMHSSGPLFHTNAGMIHVSLNVDGQCLRLTIEDNGPGMPPAVAAAFLRPVSMPIQAGRGLGHRVVHELTESTGGSLSIRVRPGRGTALSVRWPMPLAGDPALC